MFWGTSKMRMFSVYQPASFNHMLTCKRIYSHLKNGSSHWLLVFKTIQNDSYSLNIAYCRLELRYVWSKSWCFSHQHNFVLQVKVCAMLLEIPTTTPLMKLCTPLWALAPTLWWKYVILSLIHFHNQLTVQSLYLLLHDCILNFLGVQCNQSYSF